MQSSVMEKQKAIFYHAYVSHFTVQHNLAVLMFSSLLKQPSEQLYY